MVKLLYILSICTLLVAGDVVGLWLSGRDRGDARVEEFLRQPGAVQVFSAQVGVSGVPEAGVSPLVAQAEILAAYLNPPTGREKPASIALVSAANPDPPTPPVRPVAPSVRFRLCGTSYYPNEPGRSMALISETGSEKDTGRWVKEGAQLGQFVIHEIRRGVVIYRDGDQLREMAVEHGMSVPGLVRDTRSGSRQVSNAADDLTSALSSPAGPNNVGPSGGH